MKTRFLISIPALLFTLIFSASAQEGEPPCVTCNLNPGGTPAVVPVQPNGYVFKPTISIQPQNQNTPVVVTTIQKTEPDKEEIKQTRAQLNEYFGKIHACLATKKPEDLLIAAEPTNETSYKNVNEILAGMEKYSTTTLNDVEKKLFPSALKKYKMYDAVNSHAHYITRVCRDIPYFNDPMDKIYKEYLESVDQEVNRINADSCAVHHFWGHGHDVANLISQINTTDKMMGIIGQGCTLGTQYGNIENRRDQSHGYNGTWMGQLDAGYNGSMNPRLVKYTSADDFNDNKEMESINLQYTQQPVAVLQKYPKPEKFENVAVAKVNGTGFMRLTEHNWAAAILHANKLLKSGKCKTVALNFHCQLSGGMTNDQFKARFNNANAGIELKDANGSQIGFTKKACGTDMGKKPIFNIPEKCTTPDGSNLKYKLDKNSIDALLSGSCAGTFTKVSKYHIKVEDN